MGGAGGEKNYVCMFAARTQQPSGSGVELLQLTLPDVPCMYRASPCFLVSQVALVGVDSPNLGTGLVAEGAARSAARSLTLIMLEGLTRIPHRASEAALEKRVKE
jgi:hypothetical protein